MSVRNLLKGKDIYVVSCYIPEQYRQFSNGNNIFENITLHLDYLEDIRRSGDEVVFLGAFNLTKVNWEFCREDDTYLPTGVISATISDFLDYLSCFGFWQQSNVKNDLSRLDLVFTTENGNILVERSLTELTHKNRHHPPLLITIGNDDTDSLDHSGEPTTFKFNFRNADFDRITNMCQDTNFSSEFSSGSLNENVEKFYSTLFNIFKDCVPLERNRDIKSTPLWYTKELTSLKNRKNSLWRKYLKFKKQMVINKLFTYLHAIL